MKSPAPQTYALGEQSSSPTGSNMEKASDVSELPYEGGKAEYDDAMERRIRRKLDWNLMPLFFVLCTVNGATSTLFAS